MIVETVRITKRVFPVRKCVKERQQWKKFGEVAAIEKGKHKRGDYLEGEKINIETLD